MSKFKNLLLLMRPRQWFKSFYIILGAVPAIFLSPFIPFTISYLLFLGILNMILLQGVIYTLNDIADLEEDRKHPIKRKRPIASGKISVFEGEIFAIILFISALILALFIDLRILIVDFALLIINLIYSYEPVRLKDKKYLDILSSAVNFPLRVSVGWWLFEPYNQARFHLNYNIISTQILSDSIQTIFFNTPPRILNIFIEFSTITLSFVSIMGLTYFLAFYLLSLKRLAEKLWLKSAEKTRHSLKKYSTSSLKALALISMSISIFYFFLLVYSLKFSLILLTPFFIGAMIWYYKLTFKENSPVKQPEYIFTTNPKFISFTIVFLFFGLLLFLI